MKESLNKLVIGMLSLIVLSCGLFVFISISFGKMSQGILRGFALKLGHASLRSNDYFFLLLGVASTAAIIGLVLRRNRGNFTAILALLASTVWACRFMFFGPRGWLETRFSTGIDRWPAAAVRALMAVALWRLRLPPALSDFRYPQVTT
jgi:hypothetical protein